LINSKIKKLIKMEYVYTPDFTALTEVFTQTWTIGSQWLIPLVLVFLSMALVTRNIEKWKVLFFPMMVTLRIIGLPVHFLILSAGGILFVVELLSTQLIGKVLSPLVKATRRIVSDERYRSSEGRSSINKEVKTIKQDRKELRKVKKLLIPLDIKEKLQKAQIREARFTSRLKKDFAIAKTDREMTPYKLDREIRLRKLAKDSISKETSAMEKLINPKKSFKVLKAGNGGFLQNAGISGLSQLAKARKIKLRKKKLNLREEKISKNLKIRKEGRLKLRIDKIIRKKENERLKEIRKLNKPKSYSKSPYKRWKRSRR
jgi:hypothetical protein